MNPETVFILAALFSGAAGCARQLTVKRRNRKWTDILVGGLYSAILGLGVSLMWYDYFQTKPYRLVGLCILAALSGATSADEILSWIRATLRALEITVRERGKDGNEDVK